VTAAQGTMQVLSENEMSGKPWAATGEQTAELRESMLERLRLLQRTRQEHERQLEVLRDEEEVALTAVDDTANFVALLLAQVSFRVMWTLSTYGHMI